ncbi:MAG: EamA family transporter [Phycisphaerae bacterium]|nr:EamA family transporter [Phycisphaerae bacterium]
MRDTSGTGPQLLWVVLAFAAIYTIWGSTYLAIAFAIETLPPLTMAGVRFFLSGAVLMGWCRLRGIAMPQVIHWRTALISGGLMLLGGNGGVVYSEQYVPSSIAALMVALVPFWLVLLHWAQPSGTRPTRADVIGLVLGFTGMYVLVNPTASAGEAAVSRIGVSLLLTATICWAAGSLYSRSAPRPTSPFVAAASDMLAGGACLLVAGLVIGEWPTIDPSKFSSRSILAFIYLVVMGSLIGFTAYIWLLRVSTPARVATYAYVNPLVAAFLGWAFRGEPITARTVVSMIITLGGVAIIITFGRGYRRRIASPADAPVEPMREEAERMASADPPAEPADERQVARSVSDA